MVKYIKYFLLLIPFIFITNVNAVQLGTPNVYGHFNDDTLVGPSNATIDSYFNGTNNYYKSPYLMGGVSTQQWIKQIDFNYTNANLCVNNDLSISGSVAGIPFLFSEQSYTFTAMNNNTGMTCSYSYDEYGTRLNFNCYGRGGGTLSLYLIMNSYNTPKQYTIGVSRDITVSCDASNLDIISNQTQNTQNIINNNNSNTNQIIQDNQQNTQDIINNQNQNTQQEIESQKVCSTKTYNASFGDSSNTLGKYLLSDGSIGNSNSNNISSYFKISEGDILLLQSSNYMNSTAFCFYKEDKTLISCDTWRQRLEINTTAPANTYYIRSTIGNNASITIKANLCQNGNQALDDSINSLNDTLNNEDSPNTNQDISDMQDMIASDTPITDLLTLPMTLINAYYTGITSTCSPYNFGSLLGTDIIFPCINLEQKLGSNLWLIIDSLCSIFLIYSIAMLFVHAFDNLTSLKDDFDDMYVPRHAGKHVGSGING